MSVVASQNMWNDFEVYEELGSLFWVTFHLVEWRCIIEKIKLNQKNLTNKYAKRVLLATL
jgi:hypothetical protein